MANWAQASAARARASQTGALVTVLATEGSAPREAGVKMAVWDGGQAGTIGGGNLEWRAAAQARAMLAAGAGFAIQDYPLGPLLQQCCGGRVRLLLERIDASDAPWLMDAVTRLDTLRAFDLHSRFGDGRLIKTVTAADNEAGAPPVVLGASAATTRGTKPSPGDLLVEHLQPARADVMLFGAGHVGQAIAAALKPLSIRLHWYDSRPEAAEMTGALLRAEDELAILAASPPSGALVLILTHDHQLDYALTHAALGSEGFSYLGLIGSMTKRARFISRLRQDGAPEAAIARLTCPIGLPQLRSKDPAVIAISVAADLLSRLEPS